MSPVGPAKSIVEQTALAWLESVDWRVRSGAEIAPGETAIERDDYGQDVMPQRLRESLLLLVCGVLRSEGAEKFVGRAV